MKILICKSFVIWLVEITENKFWRGFLKLNDKIGKKMVREDIG